jgi:hypothetical protein
MGSGQEVLAGTTLAGEWRIANGAGGSAHGTATGPPTRRDHAWLHAWSGGRATTILLGFEEQLFAAGQSFALSEWPAESGSTDPLGEREAFTSDPWPCWRIRCGEVLLERSLFLISGQQAVAVSYRHLAGPAARLRLAPLVVARAPDQVQRETPDMQGVAHGIPGRVRIETVPGRPTLTLWHNGGFLPARLWRRGLTYAADAKPAEREDAFVPGAVECPLPPSGAVHLVAATDESLFRDLAIDGRLGTPPPSTLADCVAALARFERMRDQEFRGMALRGLEITARQAAAAHEDDATPVASGPFLTMDDGWTRRLVRGIEGALARRGGRLTVLQGDEERGADALRAVPGLIAARAFEVARGILSGALGYVDDGASPSTFDEHGAPRYEDPAAALWLLLDAELLTRRSEDPAWARVSLAPLESIAQHLRAGNRYGIRADQDGLLQVAGETPTKPLGLNLLWYYGLVAMSQLARLGGRKEGAAFYLAWARQHGQSFNELFWDEAQGCLHEAIVGDRPIAGLSPAQLHAIALSPPLLPPERAARLFERVEAELFTPLGLRPSQEASHVETEWLGAFHTACFRVRGRSQEVQESVRARLEALRQTLDRVSDDYVPASFAPPARKGARRAGAAPPLSQWAPRGVSATAAAELLRLWVEDVAHSPEHLARS